VNKYIQLLQLNIEKTHFFLQNAFCADILYVYSCVFDSFYSFNRKKFFLLQYLLIY